MAPRDNSSISHRAHARLNIGSGGIRYLRGGFAPVLKQRARASSNIDLRGTARHGVREEGIYRSCSTLSGRRVADAAYRRGSALHYHFVAYRSSGPWRGGRITPCPRGDMASILPPFHLPGHWDHSASAATPTGQTTRDMHALSRTSRAMPRQTSVRQPGALDMVWCLCHGVRGGRRQHTTHTHMHATCLHLPHTPSPPPSLYLPCASSAHLHPPPHTALFWHNGGATHRAGAVRGALFASTRIAALNLTHLPTTAQHKLTPAHSTRGQPLVH